MERGDWVKARAYVVRRSPELRYRQGEVVEVAAVGVSVNWTQNYDGSDDVRVHPRSGLMADPVEGSFATQARKRGNRAIYAQVQASFDPRWGFEALVRFAQVRMHRADITDPWDAAGLLVDEDYDFRTVCHAFS